MASAKISAKVKVVKLHSKYVTVTYSSDDEMNKC